MVIAIASKDKRVNIYNVADEMKNYGWYLSSLQNPPAFHICITAVHASNEKFIDDFFNDLDKAINKAKLSNKRVGEAKIYGTNNSIGMGLFVEDIAKEYWVINSRPLPQYNTC